MAFCSAKMSVFKSALLLWRERKTPTVMPLLSLANYKLPCTTISKSYRQLLCAFTESKESPVGSEILTTNPGVGTSRKWRKWQKWWTWLSEGIIWKTCPSAFSRLIGWDTAIISSTGLMFDGNSTAMTWQYWWSHANGSWKRKRTISTTLMYKTGFFYYQAYSRRQDGSYFKTLLDTEIIKKTWVDYKWMSFLMVLSLMKYSSPTSHKSFLFLPVNINQSRPISFSRIQLSQLAGERLLFLFPL